MILSLKYRKEKKTKWSKIINANFGGKQAKQNRTVFICTTQQLKGKQNENKTKRSKKNYGGELLQIKIYTK